MKIDYRILWIEDDKSWIRVPKLRIESKIKEYGFIPIIEPIFDCDITNLQYSDYDLILVDYNLKCGDDKYGNNILSLLRGKRILSDAIFYSNTNTDILYEKVKEGKISNVTIFDRAVFKDDNIDQIFEVITYYLKKDLDLNSMRGIMMSEVARFDNRIWEILEKIKTKEEIIQHVKDKKNEYKKDFDQYTDEEIWQQLTDVKTSTMHFYSGTRGTYLKNTLAELCRENPKYNEVFEKSKKYYDEIINVRNALAHREHVETSDEENFIKIRKNIIEHQENIGAINNLINNI